MDKKTKTALIQIGLAILTLLATTIAGAEWMTGRYIFWSDPPMTFHDFLKGFQYSIPFLLILTVHEFGHYFTARYHRVKVTLPYYIPLWLGFLPSFSFGTMGAFIKIKDIILSRKHYFDIGIAGPLAGFIMAMIFIHYGFTHLPDADYIYTIHPEYEQYGADYADYVYDNNIISFTLGDNLIYWFYKEYVADPSLLPNPNEMIHYPLLLAGYLALFFTALNLLPIGQLDGGHILFGLLGIKNQEKVSRVFFIGLIFYAGLGLISIRQLPDLSIKSSAQFLVLILGYFYYLYICAYSMYEGKHSRLMFAAVMLAAQFIFHFITGIDGYSGWLVFGLILGRFIGIQHPAVIDDQPLSINRQILGWLAFLVFVLCFSPAPFVLEGL